MIRTRPFPVFRYVTLLAAAILLASGGRAKAVHLADTPTHPRAQRLLKPTDRGATVGVAVSRGPRLVHLDPPAGLDVPMGELESRLFRDAADHRLDDHSLAEAALIAGGLDDPAVLARYRRQFQRWAMELKTDLGQRATPVEKARRVLAYLHRQRFAGGYRLESSDLREVFGSGRFNCVSATLMFNALLGELGVRTRCAEMPSHVLGVVVLADGPLDVETTCPHWFELQGNADAQRRWRESHADGIIPTQEAPRREASNIGLIAMVYYNRGVEQLRRREFAAAVAANYKAIWLDPLNAQAAGNLLAAVNNWALDLSKSGELAAALTLLEKGLWMAPGHSPLARNYAALCGRRVDQLVAACRYAEALDLLDDVQAKYPHEPWFEAARAEIHLHRGAPPVTFRSERAWHPPAQPAVRLDSRRA